MEQQFTIRVRRKVVHEYDIVVTASSQAAAKKQALAEADDAGDAQCPYTEFGKWRVVATMEGNQGSRR